MIARLPRHALVFGLMALVVAFVIVRGLAERPGYTDAFYYFNAADRWVVGDGLTDPYLWTYIGLPESIPTASHQYWMPLTSMLAALGMWVMNAPGDYAAAQWPFALLLAGLAGIGFWLGGRLGGSKRHMWVAGLLTLFSGFFTRFWGMTDNFGPYGFAGAMCLVWMGLAAKVRPEQKAYRFGFLAGIFAGLGHLARADGLLLLIVGLGTLALNRTMWRQRLVACLVLTVGYLLIMIPWFARNLDVIGSPLPMGGTQAAWYTEYDDIFNYPPGTEVVAFFEDGLSTLVESRWQAFTNNLGTFVAVEGLVVMTPLMLIGLWNRRRNAFLGGFWVYALGLHLAMTFVFAFPGFRGGLFHSSAVLIPWWAALGVVGLDDVVDWYAKRRRRWQPAVAKLVFSSGLVLLAIMLSWRVSSGQRVPAGQPSLYRELEAAFAQDARVMVNDPAALYYFTGLSGVVLPNATIDIVPEIADQYDVTHLLIEFVGGVPATPAEFVFDFDNPPAFLEPVSVSLPGARLYAIVLP